MVDGTGWASAWSVMIPFCRLTARRCRKLRVCGMASHQQRGAYDIDLPAEVVSFYDGTGRVD